MKFVVFKTKRGEYAWRLVARNGRIIAVSGEGFKRKSHALRIIGRMQEKTSLADVVDET